MYGAKLLIHFSNFNGTAIEVWERISYFMQHITAHVITYPAGIKVD